MRATRNGAPTRRSRACGRGAGAWRHRRARSRRNRSSQEHGCTRFRARPRCALRVPSTRSSEAPTGRTRWEAEAPGRWWSPTRTPRPRGHCRSSRATSNSRQARRPRKRERSPAYDSSSTCFLLGPSGNPWDGREVGLVATPATLSISQPLVRRIGRIGRAWIRPVEVVRKAEEEDASESQE